MSLSPDADRSEPPIPPAFEDYADERLPQAPAGGPGKDGCLEATFARRNGGETRLIRDRVRVPYHLTGTLETDLAPGLTTLVAQEPTGGVAQGDRHRIDLEARSGARAHVTTQGATNVHSMNANYAHLDARLRAGSGSHLEYVPGATILNADSRCLQTVSLECAPDAVAVVGDVVVTDGLTEHEPFGFDHYEMRVEARVDDRLVCADAVDLRPTDRDPRDLASVGEYTVVGTLYAFAPSEEADVTAMADDVARRLDERERAGGGRDDDGDQDSDGDRDGDGPRRDAVLTGVSTLPYESGLVVRTLGHREADVSAAVRAAWDEIRLATLEVGAPADRRY